MGVLHPDTMQVVVVVVVHRVVVVAVCSIIRITSCGRITAGGGVCNGMVGHKNIHRGVARDLDLSMCPSCQLWHQRPLL